MQNGNINKPEDSLRHSLLSLAFSSNSLRRNATFGTTRFVLKLKTEQTDGK